jgi:hypothetical protein
MWESSAHALHDACSDVTWWMSHVTRHTSHVTRHTSHVTRHTSHVTSSHSSPQPPMHSASPCRPSSPAHRSTTARTCAKCYKIQRGNNGRMLQKYNGGKGCYKNTTGEQWQDATKILRWKGCDLRRESARCNVSTTHVRYGSNGERCGGCKIKGVGGFVSEMRGGRVRADTGLVTGCDGERGKHSATVSAGHCSDGCCDVSVGV